MLAVVVPCFNEALRINVSKWLEIVNSTQDTFWVFVNDGSKDRTSDVLKEFDCPNVKVLNLSQNLGKGEAIRAGFSWALNSESLTANRLSALTRLGYLDSDGAFELADITEMLNCSESLLTLESPFKTLIGSRVKLSGRNIERDRVRHYLGRVISTYVCYGWTDAPYDTQVGFKIFVVDPVFTEAISNPFTTSWFFDIELMLRLGYSNNRRIWEMPLASWTEIGGSSISPRKYFFVLKQIIKIKSLVLRHVRNGF